uniref:DNA-directed RNA polymerase I subunit RPA49 n=1 Tax=Anopheles farauti TaxID=69004 RepID=A0A182Q5J1_9DIPT
MLHYPCAQRTNPSTMSGTIGKVISLSPANNHPVILENFGTYLAHRQHDMKGLLVRDRTDPGAAKLGGNIGNVLMVTGERQLYYGRIGGQSKPAPLRTYVARRNRVTGKLRLVEVESCKLTHVSHAETQPTGGDINVPATEDAQHRMMKLQQKFNNRAGRKVLSRMHKLPDLSTMEDKLQKALNEGAMKQSEKQQQANGDDDSMNGLSSGDDLQRDMKALSNPQAKSLADLYRPEQLMGEEIWKALTKPATELLQLPPEQLHMQNAYLEMKMKAAMQSVREGEPPAETELSVARTCIYMDLLARLFSVAGYKSENKYRDFSPFTKAIDNMVQRSFLQHVRSLSTNRNQVTKYTRRKSLMHYMALVFALEAQPKIDMNTLHRATEVQQQDLLIYGRNIGARYVQRDQKFIISPITVDTASSKGNLVLSAMKGFTGKRKRY